MNFKTRPLKMSLSYKSLVDYYEDLTMRGLNLQANEMLHLAQCREFLAPESESFNIGECIDANTDD